MAVSSAPEPDHHSLIIPNPKTGLPRPITAAEVDDLLAQAIRLGHISIPLAPNLAPQILAAIECQNQEKESS